MNPDVLPIISDDGYCENTTVFLCIILYLFTFIYIKIYLAGILQYLRGLTSGKLYTRPNVINPPSAEKLKEYIIIVFCHFYLFLVHYLCILKI
jgi:hypothetical protein